MIKAAQISIRILGLILLSGVFVCGVALICAQTLDYPRQLTKPATTPAAASLMANAMSLPRKRVSLGVRSVTRWTIAPGIAGVWVRPNPYAMRSTINQVILMGQETRYFGLPFPWLGYSYSQYSDYSIKREVKNSLECVLFGRDMTVPLLIDWYPCALSCATMLLGMLGILVLFICGRNHLRFRRGKCAYCGYLMATIPGPVCPECGHERKYHFGASK